MKKIIILLVFLFVGGILVFTVGSQDAFKDSFEKSFKVSFKKGFVFRCVGLERSHEKAELCGCIADEALKQLTVNDLKDHEYAESYIKNYIVPECNATNSKLSSMIESQ